MPATKSFAIAYTRKGDYELHAAGCADLAKPRNERSFGYEGADAADTAARFASENDGCWIAKTHACARKA
jgi:hypothetical protein